MGCSQFIEAMFDVPDAMILPGKLKNLSFPYV
jgi:hypothetical protein